MNQQKNLKWQVPAVIQLETVKLGIKNPAIQYQLLICLMLKGAIRSYLFLNLPQINLSIITTAEITNQKKLWWVYL